MKTLIVSLFLFSQVLLAQANVTTLYFIRHAEKVDNSQNPDLAEAGKIRAERWRTIFGDIALSAVYSTDLKRTLQTAVPVSLSKKLAAILYNPKSLDLDLFLKDNRGQTVLIVGHSNSTPELINKIIKEKKYENIPETVFGNLYIITIADEKVVSSQLLKLE
jgi:broad specificity phosphatase PhoE